MKCKCGSGININDASEYLYETFTCSSCGTQYEVKVFIESEEIEGE